MALIVLLAWIIQGAVGLTLFVDWMRHARGRGARTVIWHLALSLPGLAFWVWFVITGALIPAWIALAIITGGNTFGDIMLLGRARRIDPDAKTIWQRYGVAISAIARGKLPPRVSFHALFSAVVYFTCLGATVDGAGLTSRCRGYLEPRGHGQVPQYVRCRGVPSGAGRAKRRYSLPERSA